MKKVIICLLLVGLNGCASRFQTARFDTEKWKINGEPVNGVVYYEPQLVKIVYHYTALVDKDGKKIGNSDVCQSTYAKEEIDTYPNYSEPRILLYDPSIFADSKFIVKLNKGMLESINSDSAPIVSALSGQVVDLAKSVIPLAKGEIIGKPYCNSSPVISSITKQDIPWP